VIDALYDARGIKLVVNRHESGSTFMADAYAKLTGQPGVAFVTRGPGATNASIGVHTAYQDSTPMVLFVGQVGSDFVEREAFQEIDYRRMFGQMASGWRRSTAPTRIPEFVRARSRSPPAGAGPGRAGAAGRSARTDRRRRRRAVPPAGAGAPTDAQIGAIGAHAGTGQRPLVLLGGTGWTEAACENLRRFAEANQLPVACAFRYQDLFDNRHPNYVGDVGIGINPKLAQRVRDADLIAGHRPAARRDDHQRLLAAGSAEAEAGADPHPPGHGGAWARVPGGS
jgi:acetolactate synthase I/II/III large subunit